VTIASNPEAGEPLGSQYPLPIVELLSYVLRCSPMFRAPRARRRGADQSPSYGLGVPQKCARWASAKGWVVGANELLEPISKSPEEDKEAGELNKAQEVLGVVLPADEDSALPLDPGEEALNDPAAHIAG
jgi:hypothetical protein